VGWQEGFAQRTDGLLRLLKAASRGTQESGGEEFDFGPIVGLKNVPAQTGGTVRQSPCAVAVIALHIERDAVQRKLRAVEPVGGTPHDVPVVLAGDAFAGAVHLGLAMHFRARRDNQLSVVENVLGDKTDDGRFDLGRINGDDRFAGNEPTIRGVFLGDFRLARIGIIQRDRQDGRRVGGCGVGASVVRPVQR